ncbi:MAG: helix-turn-helix domain-containing protein [Leptospiraceae bacterium]|nr:helix-turn-helix domain-containing protein [Leptospiraceae bacterium]
MPEFRFKGKLYQNPVEFTLDMIGGKWKMPILWRLKDKPYRYGELKTSLGIITHKMLTTQLRDLEENGFVNREVFSVIPPKTEYTLTKKGKTVIPIIESLRVYGKELMKEAGIKVEKEKKG